LYHTCTVLYILSIGGKGFKPDVMARAFYTAVKQYSERSKDKGCLKSITIVVYEANMVQKFTNELKQCIVPSTRKPFCKLTFVVLLLDKKQCTGCVIYSIYEGLLCKTLFYAFQNKSISSIYQNGVL